MRDTLNLQSVKDYGLTSSSFANELSKRAAKDDNDIVRESSLLEDYDFSAGKSIKSSEKMSYSPKPGSPHSIQDEFDGSTSLNGGEKSE